MRPEHESPPEVFYNDIEAKKYTTNTRIQAIQAEMADRAVELLNLPSDRPCFVLDIGCGSGLSGEVLDEDGHFWVGMDISPAMLEVAREREVEGDLLLQDAGQGIAYRPGTFDGAISISCLQWLCNADYKAQSPKKRLVRFFSSLYMALAHGARAVFQFYPENTDQIELIMACAMQSGFTGGLVVDYPNSTKRKKYFLCLMVGTGSTQALPQGLRDEDGMEEEMATSATFTQGRGRVPRSERKRKNIKDKSWVLRKKEVRRKRGLKTAADSKYTARKRKPRF